MTFTRGCVWLRIHEFTRSVNSKSSSWRISCLRACSSNSWGSSSSVGSEYDGKITTVNAQYLGKYFGLTTFSEQDIKEAYVRISGDKDIENPLSRSVIEKHVDKNDSIDSELEKKMIVRSLMYELSNDTKNTTQSLNSSMLLSQRKLFDITSVANYRHDDQRSISYDEFFKKMQEIGDSVDARVWPVALCNALCGISIGIMIPCMPMLVQQIQITPSQFGVVVSAFGVAKLINNIPSGHIVDIVGRKPMMVWGMGLCGLSIAGAGYTLFPGFGVPWLILCRLATGSSLSVLSAGSQMYITDISNQRNRARMFVPMQTSFHLGMVFGPVLGGVLVDIIGISNTFFTVGCLCMGIGVMNQQLIMETMQFKPVIEAKAVAQSLKASFSNTFKKWEDLRHNIELRRVTGLNAMYWFVLSGAQMTLLPIILYQPPFEFNSMEIGGLFAYMSTVTVLTSPRLARLADKFDKVYTMLGCSTLIGIGIIGIPLASNGLELVLAITPMNIGSTGLSILPVAYSSDIVETKDRAQAQSLIRTLGDVGFVGGATAGGFLADMISIPTTLFLNSGLMVTYAMSWLFVKKFRKSKP